jgi:hypothetical protein
MIERMWQVELHYSGMAPFVTHERAINLQAAISAAKRYARANGYFDEPLKTFAREVSE